MKISTALICLLSISFAFSANSEVPKVEHSVSVSPAQATIRFTDIELKSLDEEYFKRSQVELGKFVEGNKKIYDELIEKIEVTNSSDGKGLMRSPIDNGLLGAMYEAYSNHIPLVLRPDDVWLAITAAFAHYVNHHSAEMRAKFVKHDGKKELVVITGPQKIDENYWKYVTEQMLEKMQEYTTADVREWMVPAFSTTTNKDRLVGQMTMMGAMKDYFSYTAIMMCGLSQLTLKGTLKDWQSLRSRAAKLSQFGGDLEKWSEQLLPVLDQFIDAYQGRVNEDFWKKMLTFRKVGSGGQKKFRGWFMVFAPFSAEGKYHLNSAEEIKRTGIYATLLDSAIFNATVSVPVKFITNNVEHNLMFFGGVVAPSYSKTKNEISPSVDYLILEVVKQSKEDLVKNIANQFGSRKYYEKLEPKYRELISRDEYDSAVKSEKLEEDKRYQAALIRQAAEKEERRQKLLKLSKDELANELARTSYSYRDVDQEFRQIVSESDFNEAKKLREAQNKAENEAYQAKERKETLAMPRDKMMRKLVTWYQKYENLHDDFKKVVTEAEYNLARAKVEEEYKKQEGWQ